MANSLTSGIREILAKQGKVFDGTDDDLTMALGALNRPEIADQFPDFGKDYGAIREANAPSLPQEAVRGFKRGGLGLLSTTLGGLSLVAESPFTQDGWLKAQAKKLDEAAGDPELRATVPTLEDIAPGEDETWKKVLSRDALRYAAAKVGEAAPSIVEGVGMGVAGGLAGSAVAPGPGTLVGAGEAVLSRGIIRAAIKRLVTGEVTEEAVLAGLRAGAPNVVNAVANTAKQIAFNRGSTAVSALNSYLQNAGDIYSEVPDNPGLAAGMGVISALPDTVLPAYLSSKIGKVLFPGMALGEATQEAEKVVKNKAAELLKKIGSATGKGAGSVGFEGATEYGQEAVNIVARNIAEGKDPLTFTDADMIRMREAGITGMAGGLLAAPGVAFEGRGAQRAKPAAEGQQSRLEGPPDSDLLGDGMETPPPPPPVRTVRQAVEAANALPEEQIPARVAELQAKSVLSADEDAELEILLSRAPATPAAPAPTEPPVVEPPPVTPVASETAVASPGSGILPGAPSPLATETLVETPAAVAAPVVLPASGSAAQPSPTAAVQPTLEQDLARYAEIQQQWMKLLEAGTPSESPEIQALWRENEEIKNRYGGNPPEAPAGLTAIQKESTLRNGKSNSNQNQFQAGTQTEPGIDRETAADDAAAVTRRNEEAFHAWIEGIVRNNTETVSNAESALLRQQDAVQVREASVLEDINTGGISIRTPGNYGANAGATASLMGTRPSQERSGSGQPARQSGTNKQIRPSSEISSNIRQQTRATAHTEQAPIRSLVAEVFKMRGLRSDGETALRARALQQMFAEAQEDEKKAIISAVVQHLTDNEKRTSQSVVQEPAGTRLVEPDQQVAEPVEQASVAPAGEVAPVPSQSLQEPVAPPSSSEAEHIAGWVEKAKKLSEMGFAGGDAMALAQGQMPIGTALDRFLLTDDFEKMSPGQQDITYAEAEKRVEEILRGEVAPLPAAAEPMAQAGGAPALAEGDLPLPTKAIQNSIDRSLAAADRILSPATTKKHDFENAYSTLVTHARKLEIEVPKLGTYFDRDQYKAAAGAVMVAIGQKYGTHPTEATRAKRDAVLQDEAARKAARKAKREGPPAPPKEAAPVVEATTDNPKPSEVKPTVPSAAQTPGEQEAAALAQAPGVEPVMIKGGESRIPYDTVMGIYAAQKHFTLWLAQRGTDSRFPNELGRWHYIGILGQNKDDARERAMQTARKIGRGDLTGVAFIGKDKFRMPKALGVVETPLTEAELTGIERTALGNQQIGFGKNGSVLVKDIWEKDQKWAMWAAANMTSGRGKQIADYIRALPEYIIAQDAAKEQMATALEGDVVQVLKDFQLTGTPQASGNILIGGNTYEWKDTIKEYGGRFDGETKSWSVPPDKFTEFVAKLRTLPRVARGQGSGLPAYASNPRLGKLREDVDRRPDRSGFEQPVSEYIGDDTAALLSLGEKVGMPRIVIDEQIEDVARINRGYREGKKLFLLASQPGSGKTFVLGAAIRELRRSGAQKVTYVTLRKELITQIKKDLEAYGIGDVEFITYPEMRTRPTATSDVLIFDEAHAVKNVGGGQDEVQQAEKAKQWIKNAKFTLLSTATPFENPVQAAYLEPTGIFDDPFGNFEEFAMAYGARKMTFKDGSTQIIWKRGPTSDADSKAAREFFRKEGVFTSRKTRLPEGMVDSRMVKVMADPVAERRYTLFSDAAAENEDQLLGFAVPWITNFQKRLLEAAKVQRGIMEADAALARGRFPIIFVETKAERNINIPELQEKEDAYNAAVAMAMSMKDKPPARKEFGLPPKGIVEVLTAYMNKSGESEIVIPSAEDLIRAHFGDKVAIFTGSVTPKKAQENLDAWRSGVKPVLVATMAKGGTGLSLHDKIGNHPTTQINVNLPWSATQVVQVAQRSARYGLQSAAEMQWIFAENIPFDRMLAARVGGRMADMGSLVHGEKLPGAAEIEEWSFDNKLFSETKAEAQEVATAPVEQPATEPQPTAITPEYLAKETFEELRGQTVTLEGFAPDGTRAEGQLDAADAWADTQKRRKVYESLLNCLKT